jgi:subtilisin family serine protease
VLAVSAIQQNGHNNWAFAWYSNWGPEVAFTAPGTAVYSTWIGSTYQVSGGTGQAAAHVSGVAALMLSAGETELAARDVTPVPLPPEQQELRMIDALLTVQ